MKLTNFRITLTNRSPTGSTPNRCRYRPRLELLEGRLAPATFTVLNTNDAGADSLRAAVLGANVTPGADTINFNIPGAGVKTISLSSALPDLTGPVTIAGNTQPAFAGVPLIELNGTGAGIGANGLVMKAAGSTVRSLVINNFKGNGILAFGSAGVVEGCFIGTNSAGTAALPNQFHGVLISGAAVGVRIGDATAAARNVISGNGLSGVAILGALTKSNKVLGNFIGTDVTGTLDRGNGSDGIFIGGSKNNLIGGAVAKARNVISGNGADGVEISGAGTTGNKIQGNYIGLNAGGNSTLGNSRDGIHVAAGAKTNVIGGTVSGARNIISTNTGSGVTLTDVGTSNNLVQGNAFGTNDVGFNLALGNGIGVLIAAGATNNVIGGTVTGAGNSIASSTTAGVRITGVGTTANLLQGNIIGLRLDGSGKRSNNIGVDIAAGATGNVVGGVKTGARNVISGNANSGVRIGGAGTAGNFVQGNFIGTGLTGIEPALGNGIGVLIFNDTTNNTVGGIVAAARNIISGNTVDGIQIADTDTIGNKVQGNFIGTDVTGTLDLGNLTTGVNIISGAANNTVGGTVAGARNIIAGNNDDGVRISGSGTTGNQVQGNYIGTNAVGTAAVGNGNAGVSISSSASANTIGGILAAARNVISGNNVGVSISSDANNVQGNFVGTNAAGTGDLGNITEGVLLDSGANNTIGGLTAAARNIISGNDRFGVLISASATTGNQVQGNFIGLAVNGTTALGNTSHGVFINNAAHNNSIGGTVIGAGNRIANNGGDGVLIGSDTGFTTAAGVGNSVLGNAIFSNAGQAIDLGANDGPSANDSNDPDSGPNDLLNTPVLTKAILSANSLLIMGSINTLTNKVLRIEFFARPASGLGQTFLGFQTITMGSSNTASFTPVLTVSTSALKGQTLTATITDELGNTSEFALGVTIE
jgi:hypothetical protein